MKQSDLKLLAEFAGKEFWCCGIKHYNFNPDKNIADAECLLDKLSKMEEVKSFFLEKSFKYEWRFEILYCDQKYYKSNNKSKYLAICNAVLKLIKESKK